MISTHQKEVLSALQPHADKARAAFGKKYLNTHLHVLGLTMPLQRRVAKESFSFLQGSDEDILKSWDRIWKQSDVFEVRSQALLYYGARKPQLTLKHWRVLKTWVDQVDNWEHSDRLADIYAYVYERYPAKLEKTYQQWIKSRAPWKRRASLTGLFYYAGLRKSYPSFARAMKAVELALHDADVYVQKAVGWTLRESFNVYPDQTFTQLKKWAAILSPTAWYAATEKVSRAQKKTLKQLRQRV